MALEMLVNGAHSYRGLLLNEGGKSSLFRARRRTW